MNTTLEDKFFAEFKPNGAAAQCLDYVMEVILKEGNGAYWDSQNWREYYDSIPANVAKRTDAFDDAAWPMNIKGQHRIAQEIYDNLEELDSDSKRERYIIRILEVFEDWAKAFSPRAEIQSMEQAIMRHSEYDAHTEAEYHQAIERLGNIHDRLLEIMRCKEHGVIVDYFDDWHRAYYSFGDILAAELAKFNINILEIQNKRGIWIVEKLDAFHIQCYFGFNGNYNYANSLLNALDAPNTLHLITIEDNGVIRSREGNKVCGVNLPNELNTERAKTYFTKAFESNLITIKNGKWKWEQSKVLLELFCGMVYCSDAIKPSRFGNKWIFGKGEIFPSAPLGRLFGEANLGQQRLNYRDGDNSRSAPRGWEIIAEIFE